MIDICEIKYKAAGMVCPNITMSRLFYKKLMIDREYVGDPTTLRGITYDIDYKLSGCIYFVKDDAPAKVRYKSQK